MADLRRRLWMDLTGSKSRTKCKKHRPQSCYWYPWITLWILTADTVASVPFCGGWILQIEMAAYPLQLMWYDFFSNHSPEELGQFMQALFLRPEWKRWVRKPSEWLWRFSPVICWSYSDVSSINKKTKAEGISRTSRRRGIFFFEWSNSQTSFLPRSEGRDKSMMAALSFQKCHFSIEEVLVKRCERFDHMPVLYGYVGSDHASRFGINQDWLLYKDAQVKEIIDLWSCSVGDVWRDGNHPCRWMNRG